MAPKIGDKAPDFSLSDATGKIVGLKEFAGKKAVVLYFYPKDETPGCTAESCRFRDDYARFREAGAEVIGISSDSAQSHKEFARHHNLPFILLADERRIVRRLYGAGFLFGLLPKRITYVIDKQGIVRHIFSSQLNAVRHVEEALRVLQSLK